MPFKICLIGLGRVGVLFENDPLRKKPASHLGAIFQLKDKITLVGISDIDQKRLDYCKIKYGINNCFTDYRQLITQKKPDIVIIATWTSSHFEICKYCITHQVKGIILEKPPTPDLLRARELQKLALRYETRIVINHERRWDPLYIKTHQIIKDKILGDLLQVNGLVFSQSYPIGTWKKALTEFGGGPLLHDGTHLIDMIRYFCGEIKTVQGKVKRTDQQAGTETQAIGWLESESGIEIFLSAGGQKDYFHFEIDLIFQKGRIIIGNGLKKYYIKKTSTRYTGFHDLKPETFPKINLLSNPFTGAIKEVIKTIKFKKSPFSSLNDGIKAMEIIFSIYYSALNEQKLISLPLILSTHPLKEMFKNKLL